MNRRGFSDKDMLNIVKIALIAIMGYIVIKALLQAV